ncbi:MAG: metallophosphoesterase family protein [Opitutaceae bacterium]|nr:metallophosphoesterase family protein [Opitutaceae bacterium]
MTVLHVADLHFQKRWFHWLSASAPQHDLLVIAGDLLDLAQGGCPASQMAWVSDWVRDYPGRLCLCSGDHDLEWDNLAEIWRPAYWLRDLSQPGVWVDGERFDLGGLSFQSIGFSTKPKGGAADVWVVHAPPSHTMVARRRANGCDAGDPELRLGVRKYRPRLVLCGHLHDTYAWRDQQDSIVYLNPGRNDRASFPNHIIWDTAQNAGRRVTDVAAGSIEPDPDQVAAVTAEYTANIAEPEDGCKVLANEAPACGTSARGLCVNTDNPN